MKNFSIKEMYESTKESLMLNYVILIKYLSEKYGENEPIEYGQKMAEWSANYRLGFLKRSLVKSVKVMSQKQVGNMLMKRVIESLQYILPLSHVTFEDRPDGIKITIEKCPLKKEMKKLFKKFGLENPPELYCRTYCRSLFREYLTNLAELKFSHNLTEKGCIVSGVSGVSKSD